MGYLITFLEGIVTFVSPCILPLLPVYVAYFAGASVSGGAGGARQPDGGRRVRPVVNALGFVLGFTLVFVLLGALSGTVGRFLVRYAAVLNVVCGAVVIVFGLNLMGVLRIRALQRTLKPDVQVLPATFPAAVLFGIVFSIGWTPCVGTYLGSALLLASTQASAVQGVLLLLVYSLGLGVPFVVCAVAIDKLSGAFGAIKRHYTAVNRVCGALLVAMGILMATGLLGSWLTALGS